VALLRQGRRHLRPGDAPERYIKFKGGYSIASGDFNNDHAPDLAIPVEEYGKVAILLNTQ